MERIPFGGCEGPQVTGRPAESGCSIVVVMKWPATIGDCEGVTALITDRLAVTAASSNLTCARPANERDATATDKHSKLLTNVFVASVLDGTRPCLQMPVRAPP